MRWCATAVLAAMMIGVPSLAKAQAKEGDKELRVGGSLQSVIATGFGTTNGTFDFGIGYFLSDRFEISVAPRITVSATKFSAFGQSETNWDTDGGVSFQAQYFLGAQSAKLKPYFGGTAIIQRFKTDGGSFGDNLYAGGIFGVKNYFTDKAALDFNGQYGFRPSSPGDFQLFTFTVGITYLF
jgi:hypothetical protein